MPHRWSWGSSPARELFPVGAFLGGMLGEVIGLRATLWVAAALAALSPAPMYFALHGVRTVDELAPRQDKPSFGGGAALTGTPSRTSRL